ncbi:retron St85 family effector protein [uncultured Brevundimonas sp.]|uniref:retron St85 family effector protein n=1 Tax=uncultured Brevundimonas sp. TaxID=213418 RepID=UPI0030EDE5CF
MDHPLRSDANKALRRRVVQHLKGGCSVKRAGDLVFVCGGTGDSFLRTKFSDYCAANHPKLKLFRPEHAIKNYADELAGGAFDLGKFELIIAKLSHVIVLFPEAAGSYAEVGLFSQIKTFYERTILVLDGQYQGKGGFLNLGPARQFSEGSEFGLPIVISYSDPDFELIVDRINERPVSSYMKAFIPGGFADTSEYEKLSLAYKIADLLSIATEDDVLYLFNSIYSGKASRKAVKEMLSILRGASYLTRIEPYGHYKIGGEVAGFLPAREGRRDEESSIRLELANLLLASDPEFGAILELAHAP